MSVRRIVSSPSFRAAFGDLPLASKHGPESVFVQNLPDNRYRPPVPVPITHQGGESYTVMVEAFNTSRQVFFLVYPESIVANV